MRAFLSVLFAIVFSISAWAQDVSPKQAEIDRLTAQMTAIETAIGERSTDDAALVKLRIELENFSQALIAFGVSLRPRITAINQRLEELGVPPKEGEPAEPEQLTNERIALQQEKSLNNSYLATAENLSIRASQAIDQVSSIRRQLFTDTLFRRTDVKAALAEGTGTAFIQQISTAWNELSSRFRFLWNFRLNDLISSLGLTLVFSFATFMAVRRGFRFLADTEDVPEDESDTASYLSRLTYAFWSTAVPSLAFALSLAVAYGLFIYFDVFTNDTLAFAEAILVSIAAIYFIRRLVHALLAPRYPARRLISVSDNAARILVVLALGLAVVQVLNYLFGRIYEIQSATLNLTVAKSFISSIAISLFLILIAMVKPFRNKETGAAQGWPRLVRLPILLVALFIVGAAASGYIGLAQFAATQVVVTGAILATMYIGVQSGHVLAAESVFPKSALGAKLKSLFALSDTALDQLGLLLSFVVYAIVFLVGLPLILLQWGFNQLDIQTWLYKILTDIRIGTVSISLLGIIFGVVVFVLGFLVTRRFQRWLDGAVMARSRVDPGVRNSIRTIVGYAGIVLAATIGLSAAGFDLSSLALVAGALSLGIGFGLQNVVSNFVSGLILLAERPFKVGDWIVAGSTAGFVRKISVRATEIETFQHQTVILPNSELINGAVGNWTHRNLLGRVEIRAGATYAVHPRTVHDLLLEVAVADPGVLKYPAPSVSFLGFGENALEFELRVHVGDVLNSTAVANRLRFSIFDAFEKNGIEFPSVQRSVSLRIPDLQALSQTIEAAAPEPVAEPPKKGKRQGNSKPEAG